VVRLFGAAGNNDKSTFVFPFSWRFGRKKDNRAFIFGPPFENQTDFSIFDVQHAFVFSEIPFS